MQLSLPPCFDSWRFIAKIRQAHLLAEVKQYDGAHELLKQSLTSHLDDLNLRAAYTHFLIQANLLKNAKQFVFTTLQDFDKHDIYSLCAAGLIQYMQARESRDGTPRGIEDRKKGFKRAADFYEKALTLDPLCAFAAQGLAIGTAEDALGSLGGSLAPAAPDEGTRRAKNARDALDVFGKVRESINDGSVYVNMGHCFYNRDEYDRAIESVCWFFPAATNALTDLASVRDSLETILRGSQCPRATLPMSRLVCEVDKGPIFLRNEHRPRIRAAGMYCFIGFDHPSLGRSLTLAS